MGLYGSLNVLRPAPSSICHAVCCVRRRLMPLICGERAQSITEYALIIFFCIVVAAGAIYAFTTSIATFHTNVSSVVCLPIP